MANPRMKAKLESKAFTSDLEVLLGAKGTDKRTQARLDACLTSDASNIKPNDRGDHVAAIQRALMAIKKFTGLSIPEITDAEGFYGKTTVDAVLYYKEQFRIQRDGQPLDNITGRGTLTRLDDDMVDIERGAPKPPAPDPRPPGSWTFTLPTLPLIIKQADDDPAKQDLKDTETDSNATRLARIMILGKEGVIIVPSVSVCETTLLEEIKRGGPEAVKMVDPQLFTNKTAATLMVFNTGHFWSKRVAKDAGFNKSQLKLSELVNKALMQATTPFVRTTDVTILTIEKQPDDLKNQYVEIDFSFKNDPARAAAGDPLTFAFGAIQGLRIWLTQFEGKIDGTYTGTLRYEIFDHFGADNGDVYTPGQSALYLLQRGLASGQDKSRYKAYRSVILVETTFSGNAADK